MMRTVQDRCTHRVEHDLLLLLNQGPSYQTGLMFGARLNSKDITRYRDYLLNAGFAELEQTTPKRYLMRITMKGRERLKILQEAVA